MFCRTWCFFVILCSYVNIVELTTESLSNSQLKYHSIQDEKLHKVFSTVKSEKTRRKMVRHTTAILNDDFDIPSDNVNNHENSSEINVLYENEGSGTDEFAEVVVKTTTETKSESENIERANTTAVYSIITNNVTQSTRNETESAVTSEDKKVSLMTTLTEEDSSGDDILLFTTDFTTDLTTEKPEVILPEIVPDICLNTTCSKNDLSVSVSDNHSFIAEGINLTLSCKRNSSNMLYWYKSNGSVYFLQTFGTVQELHLNVPDIKPTHSGKYMCIRWIDNLTCCNLETNISVYELPLYKYHLIIIGLIAALCLIICIFLSVRQMTSLKMYTKQFVEKHGNTKKHQLL